MKWALFFLLIGILAVGFLIPTQAATDLNDLGILYGDYGFARAINNRGDIVGTSTDADGNKHAVLWSQGAIYDLGTLGGADSQAMDINQSGQIVGFSQTKPAEMRAFIYEGDKMKKLGTLGGNYSIATAINDRGQVVGMATTPDEVAHAFLWDGGKLTDLGTLGGETSKAYDINKNSQIVGHSLDAEGVYKAFIWQNSVMTALETPADSTSTARGINSHGHVVGAIDDQAVLWKDGQVIYLGTLGGESSLATDINNQGEIVGHSRTSNNSPRAFYWSHSLMMNMGTLDGNYSTAWAINNGGKIVGASLTEANNIHAFLSDGGLEPAGISTEANNLNASLLSLTSTPSPPTPTATITGTPTRTPTPTKDCCILFSLSDFEITTGNNLSVNITNPSEQNAYIVGIEITWESAELWAEILGVENINLIRLLWDDIALARIQDTTSPTYQETNLLLAGGTTSNLVARFGMTDEYPDLFREVFGLTPENFGIRFLFDNGQELVWLETVSIPPVSDCSLYAISDFSLNNDNLSIDIANNDTVVTWITDIELDWAYAENYDTIMDPIDELSLDYIAYGGQYTWGDGDGAPRDYDSPTNTSLDYPETFPGDWNSLPPFAAGENYQLFMDFDNEWRTFSSDLVPNDFGINITFENGCMLSKEAVPRPLPTPDCNAFSVSDFEIQPIYNRIEAYITNGDRINTEVERIVLDWDHAEAQANGIIGVNNLYADWFIWDGSYIWSDNADDVGDFASVTDTSLDSPGAWYGPDDLYAGDTANFRIDFDFIEQEYDSALLNWGLTSENFGATFYFSNGCVLVYPAVE